MVNLYKGKDSNTREGWETALKRGPNISVHNLQKID